MRLIDADALKESLRYHVGYANERELALTILLSVEPVITEAPTICCSRCAYDRSCGHFVEYMGCGAWSVIDACDAFEEK